MALNNAIVCLTRGYASTHQYGWLIQRNKSIKKWINKDNQYSLVIFHEGNISKEHQSYITMHSDGQNIIFKDISSVWAGGYEGMCKFQTIDLWKQSVEFDYILRIDEDCEILECQEDPFTQVGDNVYLRSVYFAESHSETNATLPQFLQEMTGVSPEEFYNNKFVYTNVGLGKVSFFTEYEMMGRLEKITSTPLQRANRWGDLPVLGSLLNIFAKGKVGAMVGLKYKHISHDITITSNGLD